MTDHTMPGGYVLYCVELVKRWRITAEELLEGSGYDLETLSDPRTRVPVETIAALVSRGRALTGEPAYGYYLGLQMGVTAHGLLGMAVMSAPTMREAIELAIRFLPILTTALSMRLEVDGGNAALIFDEHADFGDARQSILLAALVGVWRIGLALSGRELGGFADLALPEPEHPLALVVGRERLRFNQPVHRLLFDAAALDAPYSMADPVVLQLAREQCESLLASRGLDAGTRARVRALAMHAKGPSFSLDHVARALGTSPRTLKRQLAAEGTSFSEVVDDERRQRALLLLRAPGASVKDVASRLGYANVANFTRAFHRWTGHTPSEHRAVTSRARR